LFSKCYIDINRVSGTHFDGQTLTWTKGSYYELIQIFDEFIGDLRIGIKFHVDSYFHTMCWFVGISLFYLAIIILIEINNNIKGGSLTNPKTWWRVCKESFRNLNIKRMNLKRQLIENTMNKYYDKFLKIEETAHPGNNESNTSFMIKEGKDSY
jgi:hypothetical protein